MKDRYRIILYRDSQKAQSYLVRQIDREIDRDRERKRGERERDRE